MTNDEYKAQLDRLYQNYIPNIAKLAKANENELMSRLITELGEKLDELKSQVSCEQLHEIHQVPLGEPLPWERPRPTLLDTMICYRLKEQGQLH